MLSWKFALSVFSLFAMTMIYTLWLKNKMFLDILAIAVNFVIRTISGAFILSVVISPWIILCTFFLSLFLSAGKRASELKYLKEGAVSHRKVLAGYTPDITNMLLIVSTVSLVMSYSLYTFMSIHPRLIYTLPFALYLIFRFIYFIYSGSDIARHLDKMIYDKGMVIGSVLLLALILAILYL